MGNPWEDAPAQIYGQSLTLPEAIALVSTAGNFYTAEHLRFGPQITSVYDGETEETTTTIEPDSIIQASQSLAIQAGVDTPNETNYLSLRADELNFYSAALWGTGAVNFWNAAGTKSLTFCPHSIDTVTPGWMFGAYEEMWFWKYNDSLAEPATPSQVVRLFPQPSNVWQLSGTWTAERTIDASEPSTTDAWRILMTLIKELIDRGFLFTNPD